GESEIVLQVGVVRIAQRGLIEMGDRLAPRLSLQRLLAGRIVGVALSGVFSVRRVGNRRRRRADDEGGGEDEPGRESRAHRCPRNALTRTTSGRRLSEFLDSAITFSK